MTINMKNDYTPDIDMRAKVTAGHQQDKAIGGIRLLSPAFKSILPARSSIQVGIAETHY